MATEALENADSGDDDNDDGGEDAARQNSLRLARRDRDRAVKEADKLRARVLEYEERDRKIEEDQARREKDFETLEKKLRDELKGERDKVAEFEAREEGRKRQDRRDMVLDRVITEAGVSGDLRGRVDALMMVIERDGLDVAPEDFDDKHVKALIKELRKRDSDTFKPAQKGPGGSAASAEELTMKERVIRTAKMMSGASTAARREVEGR